MSLVGTILSNTQVWGQQSSVYSQYMSNRLAFNPGYAGSQDQLNITASHRRQWENFAGVPTTSMVSVHQFVKNKGIGLGVWASSDKIGVHQDTRMYALYAYKIKLNTGTLSMGLQAGFSRISSDYSQLNLKSQDAVLSGYHKNFNPNFGTGLYYNTKDFYVGLSAPFLLNNKSIDLEDVYWQAKEARYYYLTMGKVLTIHQDIKMMPSTMIRVQEGNAAGIDLGINFILQEIFTVGAVYRSQDAFVGLMQLALSKQLNLGYSYDFTTSDLRYYSSGSHEFVINYRIPYTQLCHTYF